MIQFNPQPIEVLKARYNKAIIQSVSVMDVVNGFIDTPGSKPSHVFDFENGIRLIISRDHYNGKEYIHVSGSYEPDIYKGSPKRSILLAKMHLSFMNIAGPVKLGIPHFSKGGIPHWKIDHQILN